MSEPSLSGRLRDLFEDQCAQLRQGTVVSVEEATATLREAVRQEHGADASPQRTVAQALETL